MLYTTALVAFVVAIPSLVGAQKAGLPWTDFGLNINQFTTTSKVSWYYTYGISSVSTRAEFVPMLWGAQQASQWDSDIEAIIQALDVKNALGFNEPNEPGQSNLSPATAAALWKQHMEPLKAHGILLGSPAPSSSSNGPSWLQQFLQACSGCNVDFIAMHHYGTSAQDFISNIENYHNTFGKPIWVTEWACEDFNSGSNACSSSAAASFMQSTQAFLDSTSYVQRYAWFGAMAGSDPNDLMDSSGNINALGRQYIGA
ncbi:hypothetical protein C8T65DRAFT_34877 [Cerioporus squamosus]|nr:hypothetical protein C8T65DRAFT_34877 [Cerioporus squamosus]